MHLGYKTLPCSDCKDGWGDAEQNTHSVAGAFEGFGPITGCDPALLCPTCRTAEPEPAPETIAPVRLKFFTYKRNDFGGKMPPAYEVLNHGSGMTWMGNVRWHPMWGWCFEPQPNFCWGAERMDEVSGFLKQLKGQDHA
jgi:hypothetical protein